MRHLPPSAFHGPVTNNFLLLFLCLRLVQPDGELLCCLHVLSMYLLPLPLLLLTPPSLTTSSSFTCVWHNLCSRVGKGGLLIPCGHPHRHASACPGSHCIFLGPLGSSSPGVCSRAPCCNFFCDPCSAPMTLTAPRTLAHSFWDLVMKKGMWVVLWRLVREQYVTIQRYILARDQSRRATTGALAPGESNR